MHNATNDTGKPIWNCAGQLVHPGEYMSTHRPEPVEEPSPTVVGEGLAAAEEKPLTELSTEGTGSSEAGPATTDGATGESASSTAEPALAGKKGSK